MLSFVVFDADAIDSRSFPPRHAYLHGPDDLPLQADITLGDGVVRADSSAPHSAALVVQYHVGPVDSSPAPLGLLTLPTCLLPDRPEPYALAIELARHRIMLFLNKLEDWGLTDLNQDHPVMAQFERARQGFTAALVAQRDGDGAGGTRAGYNARAAELASKTIALAVDAGEGLTAIQAERQLRDRANGRIYAHAAAHYQKITQEPAPTGAPVVLAGSGQAVLPGTAQLGCAISPGQFHDGAQKFVQASCDFVAMPMRWVDMEPVEGKYSFANTDRWIEWTVRQAKLPVAAGPLVDFRPSCVPDWLYIWENDYETLRDLVVEHVQAVVTRYRRTVSRWTVASGLHVNTNFKVSFEQIMDLTRIAVLMVRKLHPASKIQIEIAQPWGEYHATNRRSLPPLLYAEALMQGGLNFDTLGLRVQMGHAQPGLSTRDLMTFSALLDRYAQFEKPLALTAIGAPGGTIPSLPYRPRAGAAAEAAYEPGFWRAPWSEAQQGEWLSRALTIAASKPFIQSVCWHELMDPPPNAAPPEMPHGGLLNAVGVPKPAAQRFLDLRKHIREGTLGG